MIRPHSESGNACACTYVYSYSSSYILVQYYKYILYIYTHTEVKRLKGSRVNREGYRGREAKKILDENTAYDPPDKGHYFDNPSQKKRKSCSAKSYPYRVNNRMSQKKHLLLVLQ